MPLDKDSSGEVPSREDELNEKVRSLKIAKSRYKALFTRYKNQLSNLLTDKDSDKDEISSISDKFGQAMENAMDVMNQLSDTYVLQKELEKANELSEEIDNFEKSYSQVVRNIETFHGQVNKLEIVSSDIHLGRDMWRQMKTVSIPVFSGQKSKYDSWKCAFEACIHNAPATKEYKLLQLKQYLSGEALGVIDKLGHSAASYDSALDRLERKYGGARRQIAHYLEELEHFEPIRNENAKVIDKFADLLDIAVINLTDAGHTDDLKYGALYLRLQKKLPASMIARYQRWLYEHGEEESVISLKSWILKEAEFHTIAAETLYGLKDDRRAGSKPPNSQRSHFTSEKQLKTPRSCSLCKEDHGIWNCTVFKSMPVNQRWEAAKDLKLCFRCLGTGHAGNKCNRNGMRECGVDNCQKTHNRLLHITNDSVAQKVTLTSFGQTEKHIALRTVPVIVKHGDRKLKINALLDDGSTKTYVNEDVAFQLGIEQNSVEVTVNVLNGKKETFKTMPVSLRLESLSGQVRINVDASTTKNVTGNMKVINWNTESESYAHLKGIRFPFLNSRSKVDMLIGSDYADLHSSLHEIKGDPGQPVARLTPLGWTCVGPYDSLRDNCGVDTFFVGGTYSSHTDALDNTLKQFWEIDSSGTIDKVDQHLSLKEQDIVRKTESTLSYENGHYSVGMPWKETEIKLPNNYKMATKRLENTEKKLKKSPIILQEYKKVINNYEEKGYITKVDEKEAEMGWFLPHFPVARFDKSTTKVRVVFDASAKLEGVSLNDFIEQGPKLQRELFDVLLRFRRFDIGIVCDIQEMYLRVGIIDPDRKFLRFLWRNEFESDPITYQFNRVVFGVNASPYLAQFVTQKHARDNMAMFPMAAETVLKSTYMDDSMDSVKTEQDGIALYTQLSELWGKAGIFARKWLSNSVVVLEHIPKQNRLYETDLSEGGLPGVETLGIMWLAEEDLFTFHVNLPPDDLILTKRTFLGKISSLFDPLGFLAPVLVRAKIIMQDIWVSGVDWDDKLGHVENLKAKQWFSELEQLSEIKVPRCLKFGDRNDDSSLHVFTDASCKALGTVIYVRRSDNYETFVRQVTAKSKVAPLTSVSIPRLELMAAIIGLRTAVNVCAALEIDLGNVTFWCDSTNVLWWIRGQSRRYKPFVANRIGEIHEKSSPQQWRYVPTNENPADIVSRGTSVKELAKDNLWWHGPSFLLQSSDCWPCNLVEKGHEVDKEMKKSTEEITMFASLKNSDTCDETWCLNPDDFSSWLKLVRVYAWVYRFVGNCSRDKNNRTSGELSVSDIHEAETVIIKLAQRDCFGDEIKSISCGDTVSRKSKLANLNPVIDEEKVLRSDGRLKYADFLSYDVRYPIILPRYHSVTKLIVKFYHEKGFHAAGTNQTLAKLSSKFWIIGGREAIRAWESQCMVCRRRKALPTSQIMAPLPDIRLKGSMRAFSQVAVDYGGPFVTIQGRGKRREKRYMCLFTCLLSRAVHLEVGFGLDTNSFLNAFYRMTNRRGLPTKVLSDNGTNFVGADRELRELVELMDRDAIEASVVNKGIEWHFNPPSAPHFGGAHETMIKSAKRALKAILKDADVTDEELITAFTGVEALLNSRPLTYQSANHSDPVPLTPNHFLFGQAGGEFAPDSVDTTDFNPSKRWRRVQELVRHVWKRWMKEWLPGLTPRKKWFFTKRDLQPDDIVLVVSQDTPRGKWPLGRIIEVIKGKDGHVRVARVKMGNNILTRPITKLCPLELDRE